MISYKRTSICAYLACMLVLALLYGVAPSAHAAENQKKVTNQPQKSKEVETCEIYGTVTNIQKVQRSLYMDGTPSAMAPVEIHVSLFLQARRPHGAKDQEQRSCGQTRDIGKSATYKLCSPVTPQQGQAILATEAPRSISLNAIRCLFDVVIVG